MLATSSNERTHAIAPLLDVRRVSKRFRMGRQVLYAVKDVSFSLSAGESVGLGGESGCGKSTLAKLLMGLLEPSDGSIFFNGSHLAHQDRRTSSNWQQNIQMVFQHPSTSLNPRLTVERALAEPFIIHRGSPSLKQLVSLLEKVGLAAHYLKRFPHELSGGQKQRVAIARALALQPRLLICDEPFSALDVSIQAQLIDLLKQLQSACHLTYFIISHDLSLLRCLTQQLAIMYLGQIVEWGPSSDVYSNPIHPYSQALMSAILPSHPFQTHQRTRLFLKDGAPPALGPSKGCPFYARCPYSQAKCQLTPPLWREVKPGHFTACHLYESASRDH